MLLPDLEPPDLEPPDLEPPDLEPPERAPPERAPPERAPPERAPPERAPPPRANTVTGVVTVGSTSIKMASNLINFFILVPLSFSMCGNTNHHVLTQHLSIFRVAFLYQIFGLQQRHNHWVFYVR